MNKNHAIEDKKKALYSELAVPRESAPCILTETQGQAEKWEAFLVEKGTAPGMP